LEHYLKQLRLPTMVREFPKLAEQCAKEGATFEQFLLRLPCWRGPATCCADNLRNPGHVNKRSGKW
jgi:hypothetical protein